MKRIIPIFLIMLCFLGVSCGTSRFTFDRTEKNIKELGGTYSKEVGEERCGKRGRPRYNDYPTGRG